MQDTRCEWDFVCVCVFANVHQPLLHRLWDWDSSGHYDVHGDGHYCTKHHSTFVDNRFVCSQMQVAEAKGRGEDNLSITYFQDSFRFLFFFIFTSDPNLK